MPSLMTYEDLALRLLASVLIGSTLGLNRWLHHKSAGIRTHALVAIGAAVAVLLVTRSSSAEELAAQSRVIQGIIAGVGFLGAGVILRGERSKVHGLTTAASIWACALLGAACGAGRYAVAIGGLTAILLVLVLGSRLETLTARMLRLERESEVPEQDDGGDSRVS